MDFPNFSDPQFVDSAGTGGLNAAFSTVSGSVANAGSGLWAAPGLVAPESATISFSGLIATIGLAQPFGVVTVSGSLAHAHGTLTGQSTTTYSPDFSSLIPATGSVTAYAVATVQQIQQNPFPIPGPPPGHPSYNPNFVPTVGYANNQQTLAVSATTTAADNVSTFELLRTTLTAGQSSVTSWSTAGQKRAPLRSERPVAIIPAGAVAVSSGVYALVPAASGITTTLSPASGAAGTTWLLSNPLSGTWTIAAAGTDTFAGFGQSSGSSLGIPTSGSVALWANGPSGQYQVIGGSPSLLSHGFLATASNTDWVCPLGTTQVLAEVWGGGAAGASSTSTANAGGGGGGGEYRKALLTVVPGASYSIVVGAGGASISGLNGANGNPGGNSSFGSFITSVGGNGGTAGNSSGGGQGGSGGRTGSGGTLWVPGSAGSNSVQVTSSITQLGQGGGAFGAPGTSLGFQPTSVGSTSEGGSAPGGGGAGSNGGTSGAGANGLVVLSW